ncbi:MAG: urocanate hydratase [Cryomorphaceae bacterium]|nr:urocanate hydratase [Cryomorphaceae bacterium]
MNAFSTSLIEGIPQELPAHPGIDAAVSHAPIRKDILTKAEKGLALKNALRYFPAKWHTLLGPEFAQELKDFGRIYMYRFMPDYAIHARPIGDYPASCPQAAAIMLMIQNNLDPAVAQHPQELITYGGNGSVFQNWAQYLLTMKYLATMTEEQTLHMHSGHPQGLFPSSKEAPRVVVTNGMVIPNYSSPDDWERMNALGVSQYGQMTAGSYMYIGPQGIVHGTTITVMNAARKFTQGPLEGKIFVTAGLGGMSGAQPKAASIAGMVSITAEINSAAAHKRHQQGWVDALFNDVDAALDAAWESHSAGGNLSIAFVGNAVDLWERIVARNMPIDLGSDQTSLHNPWAGGYYPQGYTYAEANALMVDDPEKFKAEVQATLRRHVSAVNALHQRGMYFFDYGNAFLLESSRAGADVMAKNGLDFAYPSYVQDILGPLCFDYGFGPFRWVCASGDPADLRQTDEIAATVLRDLATKAPEDIRMQMEDNIRWIEQAEENRLVVGSQARILYADSVGRIAIATAFNTAIARGQIGPIVLGRDHHDVSGTDSPYRETSNIYDGSRFTADMAVHNAIGDSFRGATWVSLHNGGGVGWGEVINGGFGMYLDGSADAQRRLSSMLFYDVNNGIARRAWARNPEAQIAIGREMERHPALQVTLAENASDSFIQETIDRLF